VTPSRFELSKWYLDCVSDAGDVVIVYAAVLRWGPIRVHYGSVLSRPAGGQVEVHSSLRAVPDPGIEGDVLTLSAPALEVDGTWTRLAAPVSATIFESPEGKVHWECLHPRARVELTVRGRAVMGAGYAERLLVTVEPWRMPIDELRWGRFIGERSALVWIDWRGGHRKQVVLLDGKDAGNTRIDEAALEADSGARLALDQTEVLRHGAIGKTALSVLPSIERFPARILALDETKWCSRGTLTDARGVDRGWVIHEIVKWPVASTAAAPSRAWLGKVLYGLLFAAVLPALLVLWARATKDIVTAPPVRALVPGVAACAAGALLMVAGWLALVRHGGGLPMNAFPPPRLVTRGVYAIVPHPIYVGFSTICFGASLATGSASGLWLVSPTVALGALALVLGYERQDLIDRFGADRVEPILGLPRSKPAPARPSRLVRMLRVLWEPLRAWAERRANSWSEWRIGPVRIINHGAWGALASFGGIMIIGTLVGPGHVLAVAVAAAAGLVGAGLWAQWIEGASGLSRPYGFYGGLLGICFASLAGPWLGTPVWLLLGAYAVAGPYVQSMGRVRCLVQGCCHGRQADPAIGIRVRHPRSRVVCIAHLDDVPLHPTQLYSILWNVVTMGVVGTLWGLHAALHLVGGVFFLLNGLGRFVEEAYRGEPQTPIYGRLRLYQWVALGSAVAGALITALARSAPAPAPAPNLPTLWLALLFAVVNGIALGVDFPESSRRFSRLA